MPGAPFAAASHRYDRGSDAAAITGPIERPDARPTPLGLGRASCSSPTLEGLVTAAVLALTAAGLSLVFGIMRVVNVAHGEFFMLGAVVAWFVTDAIPGPAPLAFAAALLAAPLAVGAVAVAADRLVLKRLDYDPEATIVATIGLLYILQQLALTTFGPDARPVPAPFDARLQLPGFGYSGYKLAVIAAAAADPRRRLADPHPHPHRPRHARDPVGPRDRHRLRHRRRPGLRRRLRPRRRRSPPSPPS